MMQLKFAVWFLLWLTLSAAMPGVALAKPAKQPNILLILADDLGFADIGAFGGEIPTPKLDELARSGLQLTRFYTSSQCAPTRAMLMSGVDSHLAGLGAMQEGMSENQVGQPGYEGYLNNRVVSMASLLKDAGYHTYMAGKWHLGTEVDQTPTARGFDRSFSLLTGSASHFNDMAGPTLAQPRAKYWEDGKEVFSLPESFYSTSYYTSRMIEYIDSNKTSAKPFFAYLAYTAPHWPIQALDRDLARQRGKYDEGYDVIRARRFEKLKAQGVIPANASLPPSPASVIPWNSLSPEQKKRQARLMEVYAAMVDRMDYEIGRVVAHLKRNGLYDNTVIVFMSDNGADSNPLVNFPVYAEWVKRFDDSYENIGRKGSFSSYDAGWASAGEAPFRLYKWFSTEGGIRSPALIVAPNSVRGQKNDSPTTVLDVLPTLLDLAGAPRPGKTYKGREVYPLAGRSMLPLLSGTSSQIRGDDDTYGMEIVGRYALIKGDWKIIWVDKPWGTGDWELFRLEALCRKEQCDYSQQTRPGAGALARFSRGVAAEGAAGRIPGLRHLPTAPEDVVRSACSSFVERGPIPRSLHHRTVSWGISGRCWSRRMGGCDPLR
ncbi:MAG: arylsulfatase [Proteobacteria bacterium]|nr:arylsulfatase [Pseudomonadota bacterium]